MSANAEASVERPKVSLGDRIKLGIGAALGIGSVLFGGAVGYKLDQEAQANADQHHLDNAAYDRACIKTEHTSSVVTRKGGKAIVRLAALSPNQRSVCGLSDVENYLQPFDSSNGVGVPLPHDSEIVTSSVKVTMPSTGELQDSINDNIAKATNGTTVLDGAERAGATMVGGFFGAAAFIIGAAGVATAAGRMRQS